MSGAHGAVLKQLLQAERDDLVDGFVMKAALAAFTSPADTLQLLNSKLAEHKISVKVLPNVPMDCIESQSLIKHGIVSSEHVDGYITINVLESFLDGKLPVIKALVFQGVCLHQLIHRHEGHDACKLFTNPREAYNAESELEALAGCIVHDMMSKELIALTGKEKLQELSPRVALLLDNSKALAAGSTKRLHEYIKKFTY